MHYRISLHIPGRRMQRPRGESTPISSLHILPGGMLKLRIISQFKKLYICTHMHICRTANNCISFPSKTNGKRYQLSYASAFVAVHFAPRWERVTIPRDDILKDAGQKQEHCWTKATWLTYGSVKQSWTQARLMSNPLPGSEHIRGLQSDPAVQWELQWRGWECLAYCRTWSSGKKKLLSNGLWY